MLSEAAELLGVLFAVIISPPERAGNEGSARRQRGSRRGVYLDRVQALSAYGRLIDAGERVIET
jgi:hypothetical protein